MRRCDLEVHTKFLIRDDIRPFSDEESTPDSDAIGRDLHPLDDSRVEERIVSARAIMVEIVEILPIEFANSNCHKKRVRRYDSYSMQNSLGEENATYYFLTCPKRICVRLCFLLSFVPTSSLETFPHRSIVMDSRSTHALP